jgi:hypothetical protein
MGQSIKIGGSKGHLEELVTDPIFITLFNSFKWRMINNCTGRYTCTDHSNVSHLQPVELLLNAGVELAVIDRLKQYFVDRNEKDRIYIVPFADDCSTGIITYVKMNENDEAVARYVHTLNSASGFKRKLRAINVVLSDDYLVGLSHELNSKVGL